MFTKIYSLLTCLSLVSVIASGCNRSAPDASEANDSTATVADLNELTNPDVPTGARQILDGHFIAIRRIQLSADGSSLLVDFQAPSDDPQQIVSEVSLFDWQSEERVDNENDVLEFRDYDGKQSLPTDSAAVSQIGDAAKVKVNSDGSRVAVWESGSAPLRILDTETGNEIHSLRAGVVSNVAFSPNGRLIAVAGQSSEGAAVRIWDIESGEQKCEIDTVAQELGFSPDGRLLWTTVVLSREADQTQQQSSIDAMNRSSPNLAVSSLQPVSLPFAVNIWSCKTGDRVHRLETGLYRDGFVSFLSNHEIMTAGSPTAQSRYESPTRIYVWDLNSDLRSDTGRASR